jgi:methionine biosynthesis protein MetW
MQKLYYDTYWKKRLKDKRSYPIPDWIPDFLKKYTAYGAIVHQIPLGSKILDLGCGNGNVSQIYLHKGEVTGVDISNTALNVAKRLGITTTLHDLNMFPYPLKTKSFDVVILTDVLEHCIDPIRVLKEIHRIVTPNGHVIITVPNFARLGNRLRMVYGDPVDLLHFSKYGDDVEHLHWFTKPKLEYIFTHVGFINRVYLPTGLQNFNFIFGLLGFPDLGNFITVILSTS